MRKVNKLKCSTEDALRISVISKVEKSNAFLVVGAFRNERSPSLERGGSVSPLPNFK